MNKVLPTFLFFLFSLYSFSQNDLIGEWYLDYIIKEGVTHPNYFNDNQIFEIEFTNNENGFEDYLNFAMNHGCNASSAMYNLNTNEINIIIEGTTLVDCLTRAHATYEALFFSVLTFETDEDTIIANTYSITGVGNEQTLTLVNNDSGDSLIFKKQAPTTLLVSRWWLHQIDIPGNPIIDISSSENHNITFTNTIENILFIPEANGNGECNGFNANYNVTFNGANNLSIGNFSQTLLDCGSDNEITYFQILGDDATNFFEFEIINNGTTLILTDLLGARLIFGDETLSNPDRSIEHFNITLKENPVNQQLNLDIQNALFTDRLDYEIYSFDGKLVKSSGLNETTINIEDINSGIYFIHFFNKTGYSFLKFIKK